MDLEFNEEQQYILDNMHIPLQVSAGAGSGKTRVLVERYYRLIRQGVRMGNILAVTFTRRAAGEMVDRIRKRIAEDKSLKYEARSYLEEELAFAFIGTIHSICARLLRENPLKAGIDPYFQLLDEVEAYKLKMEAIRSIVYEHLEKDGPYLREYIKIFGLKALFSDLYDFLQITASRGLKIEELVKKTGNACLEVQNRISELLKELEASVCELEGVSLTLNKGANREKIERLLADFPAYLPWLESLRENPSYNPETYKILEKMEGYELKAQGGAGESIRKFKDILTSLKAAVGELKYFSLLEEAFLPLAVEIRERIEEEKKRLNLLDFDDLEARTLAMLQDNPDLLEKYQQQFQYIMVDEFQDTNYRQVEIFRLLSRDFKGNIFTVGDPKQSIYRFRGAKVELFGETGKKIEKAGEIVGLNRNYRTLSPIIEFINHFFGKVMSGEAIPFEPLVPERISDSAPKSTAYLVGGYDEQKMKRQEVQAYLAAAVIQEMAFNEKFLIPDEKAGKGRVITYGDIALLFRTTANMHIFSRIFKDYGIPCYVIGSRDFFTAEEVAAMLELLKAVQDSGDEIALAGALRSFFFQVENETLWLLKKEGDNLRESLKKAEGLLVSEREKEKVRWAENIISRAEGLKNRLAPSELIRFLWEETRGAFIPLAYSEPEQKAANISKLAGIAFSLEEKGINSLRDFLAYIDEARNREIKEKQASIDKEAENRVKLMTIHQSKGLEFPVVIVPELEREFNEEDIRRNILVRDKDGVFMRMGSGESSREERKASRRGRAEQDERRENISEYKRLLYVALTRSRDLLILTGLAGFDESGNLKIKPADSEPRSWLDLLLMAYGIPGTCTLANPFCRFVVGSMIDIPEKKQALPVSFIPDSLPHKEKNPFRDKEKISLTLRRVSPTFLAEYSHCPLSAYMTYGEKVNIASLKREKEGLSSAGLGRIVHYLAEKSDSRQKAEQILKNYRDISDTEKEEALGLFEVYLASRKMADIRENSHYCREVPFILKIGESLYLNGIIDGLGIRDDEVYIVDLKTGQKREEYGLQLAAYRRAAEKILPGRKINTLIFYLKSGEIEETGGTLPAELKPEHGFYTAKSGKCAGCVLKCLCFPEEGRMKR